MTEAITLATNMNIDKITIRKNDFIFNAGQGCSIVFPDYSLSFNCHT